MCWKKPLEITWVGKFTDIVVELYCHKHLAVELGKYNSKVVTLRTGPINTDMFELILSVPKPETSY